MFIIVLNKKLNEPVYQKLSRSTKDCEEETCGQKTSEHWARKYSVDFILHLLLLSQHGLTRPVAGACSTSACGSGDATLNMYYSIINPVIHQTPFGTEVWVRYIYSKSNNYKQKYIEIRICTKPIILGCIYIGCYEPLLYYCHISLLLEFIILMCSWVNVTVQVISLWLPLRHHLASKQTIPPYWRSRLPTRL